MSDIRIGLGRQCWLEVRHNTEPVHGLPTFQFHWRGSPHGGSWRNHLTEFVGRAQANLFRFGGAGGVSVGRHSLLMAWYLQERFDVNHDTRRFTLWHDAPESLGLGDIHHGVKHALGERLIEYDRALTAELLGVARIDHTKVDLERVKAADRAFGAAEAIRYGLVTGGEDSVPGVHDVLAWFNEQHIAAFGVGDRGLSHETGDNWIACDAEWSEYA